MFGILSTKIFNLAYNLQSKEVNTSIVSDENETIKVFIKKDEALYFVKTLNYDFVIFEFSVSDEDICMIMNNWTAFLSVSNFEYFKYVGPKQDS